MASGGETSEPGPPYLGSLSLPTQCFKMKAKSSLLCPFWFWCVMSLTLSWVGQSLTLAGGSGPPSRCCISRLGHLHSSGSSLWTWSWTLFAFLAWNFSWSSLSWMWPWLQPTKGEKQAVLAMLPHDGSGSIISKCNLKEPALAMNASNHLNTSCGNRSSEDRWVSLGGEELCLASMEWQSHLLRSTALQAPWEWQCYHLGTTVAHEKPSAPRSM